MKPWQEVRKLFTPYELGSGGMLISYLFIASGFLFGIAFHRDRAVFPAFIVGTITMCVTWCAVRCPHCGKSALKRYLLDEHTLGGLFYVSRGWPERVCSSCRTPLDIL